MVKQHKAKVISMHYKKTQISDGGAFEGLHGLLGQRDARNLPAGARRSDVMFGELSQLSGGKLAQFSRSLAASFGAKPWKVRQAQDEEGVLGISAEALQAQILQSAESYIRQAVRSQVNEASPLRGRSGGASRNQAVADFANMMSRAISRDG